LTREDYDKAVKEHSGRLYRFLLKNLRDADDASDLVQDAYEKLWINREKVNAEKAKSWLFTTAHNAFINLLKKRGRNYRMEDLPGLQIPDYSQTEKRMAAREVLEIGLSQLSDQQRSIILLRDLEGYNYDEIGEIMDLNESQVKVYLFRARQKMKNLIKDISF
jgi:RNA polymerase sigma factor (sigma-70 family)